MHRLQNSSLSSKNWRVYDKFSHSFLLFTFPKTLSGTQGWWYPPKRKMKLREAVGSRMMHHKLVVAGQGGNIWVTSTQLQEAWNVAAGRKTSKGVRWMGRKGKSNKPKHIKNDQLTLSLLHLMVLIQLSQSCLLFFALSVVSTWLHSWPTDLNYCSI